MSKEVKVPILEGTGTTTKIREDPSSFGIRLLPDIAFLRQLSIQGRMRYFQGTDDSDINITPPTGETLFIAGGSWSAVGAQADRTIIVSNDGNIRETIFILTGTVLNGNFNFGIDSLVGNNLKSFLVQGSGNTSEFNLWGWTENTSRIRNVTI